MLVNKHGVVSENPNGTELSGKIVSTNSFRKAIVPFRRGFDAELHSSEKRTVCGRAQCPHPYRPERWPRRSRLAGPPPFVVHLRPSWEGFVMAFTPGSETELEVVFQLVVDSYPFVSGTKPGGLGG